MGPYDLDREQRATREEARPPRRLDAVEDSDSHLLSNRHPAEDSVRVTAPVPNRNPDHKRDTRLNRVWDKKFVTFDIDPRRDNLDEGPSDHVASTPSGGGEQDHGEGE